MEQNHLPRLNTGQVYSGQTWENPPYKGGWWKISYHQEGRYEPEYPKTRISSQMAPSSRPYPLNEVRRLSPNVNLRPRVILDIQVRLPTRDGDERSHLLAVELWLTPEKSTWQRLWGTVEGNRLWAHQAGEARGYRHSHHQFSHAFNGIFACGYGGSPDYSNLPLFNLIHFVY